MGYSRQIITLVKTKRIWGNSLQKIKRKKRNRWIWTYKKKIRNRRDYYWFNEKRVAKLEANEVKAERDEVDADT